MSIFAILETNREDQQNKKLSEHDGRLLPQQGQAKIQKEESEKKPTL